MTPEQIKAAVLKECERLAKTRDYALPFYVEAGTCPHDEDNEDGSCYIFFNSQYDEPMFEVWRQIEAAHQNVALAYRLLDLERKQPMQVVAKASLIETMGLIGKREDLPEDPIIDPIEDIIRRRADFTPAKDAQPLVDALVKIMDAPEHIGGELRQLAASALNQWEGKTNE